MRGKPNWISVEVRRRKQEAGCFYLGLASLNAWLFSPLIASVQLLLVTELIVN